MSDKKEIVVVKNSKTIIIRIIIAVIAIIALIASFVLFITSSSVALNSAIKSSEETFLSEKQKAYENFEKVGFDIGEKNNHVSNRVSINILAEKEVTNLEVLSATLVKCSVIKDEKNGIESWDEIKGEGIYIINLETAEYIVDEKHKTVCVRIPEPELTSVKIIEKKPILWENKGGNDSDKDGINMAMRIEQNAISLMKTEFSTNPNYYNESKKSAKEAITNLVLKWNPDVKDLKVTVEFY